jgi:ribonuclease-3
MEATVKELEAALGHTFARQELLVRALTHRSLAHEEAGAQEKASAHEKPSTHEKTGHEKAGREKTGHEKIAAPEKYLEPAPGDNERLEFLGDAVLGLVVAQALFENNPDWTEGELTRMRANLVSRQNMAKVAAAIGLGRHLRLSKGEDRSGLRRKGTVLSNTMEAVLGALFLDGGPDGDLAPVRAFVRKWVMGETAEQLARELRSGDALGNYKSALQEHLQSSHTGTPVYRVKSESGPDHRKRFLVEVRLKPSSPETGAAEPGKPLARGSGSTKKHAEQDAARRALVKLAAAGKTEPEPDPAEPAE